MLNLIATLFSIALIAAIVLAALGVVAWAFNLLAAMFAAPASDSEIARTLANVTAEQATADAELATARRRTAPEH